VLLPATIDSLTNLVSDAAHAPTTSHTSHFRVHPSRPCHHIAAVPQSRWASAVVPMASDLGDSEIGSSSSGSQHAPLLPLATTSNAPQASTLSVHELGRLCQCLPPTMPMSIDRSADGERPWRQPSSSGSQHASVESLLPPASNAPQASTLSVHELGRLCKYLPPTMPMSIDRSADGERSWRQSSSSGSQHAPLLPLATTSNAPQASTLSVHELGRLCQYLPPTIPRSIGRSAHGERPWRQSSSGGSQYASPPCSHWLASLLVLASNARCPSLDFQCP